MFGLQLTVGSVVFFLVTLRLTIQAAMKESSKENRAYAAGDTVRYHISQRVRNLRAAAQMLAGAHLPMTTGKFVKKFFGNQKSPTRLKSGIFFGFMSGWGVFVRYSSQTFQSDI